MKKIEIVIREFYVIYINSLHFSTPRQNSHPIRQDLAIAATRYRLT
jgi:hypothetical protein